MSRLLHKFIHDHVQRRFPECDVVCATNPNEEWLVHVYDPMSKTNGTYLATMDGDTEVLMFRKYLSFLISPLPASFDIGLTPDEWTALAQEGEG
jgi:hypothetical protein